VPSIAPLKTHSNGFNNSITDRGDERCIRDPHGRGQPGQLQRIPSEAGDTNTEWSPVAALPKQCQLQNKEYKPNTQSLIE
jgi:hypothetical protein